MPRDPRAVLRGAGLRPKKALGQNFLVAEPIARAIAAACVPEGERGRARVVEIGAGTGALTTLLAERAREVVAIERDPELARLLAEGASECVKVLEADARSVDLRKLLGDPDPDSPRVLCGNLPYVITGPLLRAAVDHAGALERVVFMVQDEVASRLLASPGSENWGALTVFVRAAFEPRKLLRASPGAFHPRPEVTSAVVALDPLRPRRAAETDRFRELVRRAFEARRKTLRNAWAGLAPEAAGLARAASAAGISLDARGETLDVEAFARMADALDGLSAPRQAE